MRFNVFLAVVTSPNAASSQDGSHPRCWQEAGVSAVHTELSHLRKRLPFQMPKSWILANSRVSRTMPSVRLFSKARTQASLQLTWTWTGCEITRMIRWQPRTVPEDWHHLCVRKQRDSELSHECQSWQSQVTEKLQKGTNEAILFSYLLSSFVGNLG